jgi:hypothetical protein
VGVAAALAIVGGVVIGMEHTQPSPVHTVGTSQVAGHTGGQGGHR